MIMALPEETNCRILYRNAKAGLSLCSLSGSSTGHFQRDSEHLGLICFLTWIKPHPTFFPESLPGYQILPKACRGTQELIRKTPSSRNWYSIKQKKGGNNWVDSLYFYWSPPSLFSSWRTLEKRQINPICPCLSRIERDTRESAHPAEAGFPPH